MVAAKRVAYGRNMIKPLKSDTVDLFRVFVLLYNNLSRSEWMSQWLVE